MEQPHHDSEVIAALRIGLIADAEGARYLTPALASPALEIVAQSGMRPDEGVPGVPWHDDARAMVAQSGLHALILATSPRAALELDEIATNHALPVWRLPPLATNFAEATELVGRLRQRAVPYRVASWWDAVADDVRWALAWRENFKPLFTWVRVSAAGPGLESWRASAAQSPGGALATDAYGLLEALVAVRGLPERVSASVAHVRRRSGEAPRETEDLAIALMRYESGASAAVQASWDTPPFGQSTVHHGAELTVTLEPERVAVRAADGVALEERRLAPEAFLRNELARFVAAVRRPQSEPELDAALERHIAVLALLQTVYLSARTGQPESPRKFYEVQNWPEPRS